MKRQLPYLILVTLSILIALVACVPTSMPSPDVPTVPPTRMQVTAIAEKMPPASTDVPATPTTMPPTTTPPPPATGSVGVTRAAVTPTSSPTRPAPTAAPITILEVLPKAGSEWSPITTVSVRFSGPMDQEKTRAAFSIEPRVPGNLEWHENNVLELHSITDRLLPHTTYTVTLDTTAVDANGQPILTQPYTWTFTTVHMQALSEFGSGPRVQVLSRDGRQAVQFAARQDSPEAVTFDLARVSLDAWLHDNAWEGGEPVQSWHQTLIRPDWYSIPQETMLPGLPSGLYRLDMKVGRYIEDRLLLIISDLLLTVKEDAGHLLAWVQTADGRTLADADVTVYQAGTPVANGRTAADGTTLIPFTAAADDAAIIVVARHGEEIVAVQLNRSFGASSRARSSDRYQIGTYTDRPVYYPGDDVFFRTIIRWREDADPQMIPVGTAVVVSLEQFDTATSRWQPVESQTLLSSHFGSVHGRFQLPQEPGGYRLNSAVEGHTHTTAFTVQPQSETPFSVTVTTECPHLRRR